MGIDALGTSGGAIAAVIYITSKPGLGHRKPLLTSPIVLREITRYGGYQSPTNFSKGGIVERSETHASSACFLPLPFPLSSSARLAMVTHLMFPPLQLIPGAIAELFAQVSSSGEITLADRYGLMAAIFEEALSDDERCAVDRLLKAVCRGRLQPVDKLSVVL